MISDSEDLNIAETAYIFDTDIEGRKKGNVLFNEALNTFYLRLYGIIAICF